MDSLMKIDLVFFDYSFSATVTIQFEKNTKNEFVFLLNYGLKIKEIVCNNQTADWNKIDEVQPSGRSLCQKILIQNQDYINTVAIKYSGMVATYMNVITDEVKSLSWYSAWYPQDTSIELLHDEVIIHDCSDYYIVKGTYDEIQKTWKYGNQGYDPYNIIAYKKEHLQVVSGKNLNIYFVDKRIKERAEKTKFFYTDVIDYYNRNLFTKKQLPTLDYACLSPVLFPMGAYKRNGLIVGTTLGDNDLETAWQNAHELAHEWCSGADCASWEDWLNETTAEWSSLLYALDRNRMDLFNFILKQKLDNYSNLPAIKTFDGSRPEGVHNKGTVLFYEVYQKFGVDVIKEIVRAFVNLKIKTTIELLDVIRTNISPEVTMLIKNGITKQ